MNTALILSGIGVCLYSITLAICITMLILICIRIRALKSNVSILLTCNTYFNSLLVSSIMLLMYSYTLRGNLDSRLSFGGQWCEIRTYLTHVCFCSLYYSFVLQAIFRLFRIIFYKYKILQSFGVFLIAIMIQWILSFLCILPNLLLNDFQYLPTEYNCWIAFENIRGLILVLITIFNNPLSIIFTIYTQIIRYTRRPTQIQQRRKNSNKRDLIILKRIVILVFIVVGIGLPTAGIVLTYMITKYVVPFAYHIQGLSISLGVLVESISLIFITPQIQDIFRWNQARVYPVETRVATVAQQNKQDKK
ncbi:unnamed protein product [Adineta steineri]|uniref:G-protein coupled receptors family 1 profile domain-containing protein n=1 Tax=Adineta steineri TaxID=433720 RepID=A0A814CDM7_9BILA|nr:unnamed protein product [Adineta steineri]CAF1203403.1 unnamed protein product [Adineta steineri]